MSSQPEINEYIKQTLNNSLHQHSPEDYKVACKLYGIVTCRNELDMYARYAKIGKKIENCIDPMMVIVILILVKNLHFE